MRISKLPLIPCGIFVGFSVLLIVMLIFFTPPIDGMTQWSNPNFKAEKFAIDQQGNYYIRQANGRC